MASMQLKSQHRNRGSRSFLGGSLPRGIARGRSDPNIGITVSTSEYPSQSSISCDPYAQAYSGDRTDRSLHPCPSKLSTRTTANLSRNKGRGDVASPSIHLSDKSNRQRKRLRLSWVQRSLSTAARGGEQASDQPIRPATSMVSVSDSSISSPKLTSTTNIRVASASRAEHIKLSVLVSPPSLGSQHDTARKSEETIGVYGFDKTPSWNSSVRSVRVSGSHARRVSAGAMLTASWSRRKHENQASEDASSVSRFRLGKLVSCREKLHYLSERLQIIPHVSGTSVAAHSEGVKAKEIQTHDVINESRSPLSRATSLLPKLHSDTNTNSRHSSLSRSFVSAIGKLDLSSSPTLVNHSPDMGLLRRVKPETGLSTRYKDSENAAKGDSNNDDTTAISASSEKPDAGVDECETSTSFVPNTDGKNLGKDNNFIPPLPKHEDESTTSTPPSNDEGKSDVDRLEIEEGPIPPMPATPRLGFATLAKTSFYHHPNKPLNLDNASSSKTASARSTHEQVKTRGLLGSIQPGALKSHPDVNSFAFTGPNKAPITPDQRSYVIRGPSRQESDDSELKEAPMYTPETGALEHVTRTPSPIVKKAISEPVRARVQGPTPVKRTGFNKLKKSISGLFSKSANKFVPSAAVASAAVEEEKEERSVTAAPVRTGYESFTPSPLRNEAVQVRRRRGTVTSEEKRHGRVFSGGELAEYEESQKHVVAPYE